MTILGIETSTAVCSVGLFREGKPNVEQSLQESHIHSEKLLTLVQQVIRSGETALARMDAIAVSIGPGSFTGLRIGLSTAKGLSYALDKPLVAVSTFKAIAEAARQRRPSTNTITVLIDAKKGEWYVGQFRVAGDAVQELMPIEVKRLEEGMATVRKEASSLLLTDRVADVSRFSDAAVTVEDVHPYCQGAVVAALGYRKVLEKEFSDVPALEPMYLKDFIVRSAASVS